MLPEHKRLVRASLIYLKRVADKALKNQRNMTVASTAVKTIEFLMLERIRLEGDYNILQNRYAKLKAGAKPIEASFAPMKTIKLSTFRSQVACDVFNKKYLVGSKVSYRVVGEKRARKGKTISAAALNTEDQPVLWIKGRDSVIPLHCVIQDKL